MEKLKIGDKVYHVSYSSRNKDTEYKFETVERLTKTQAILSNGTKLANEPTKVYFEQTFGYSVYGNNSKRWFIETDEILIEAEKEKIRQRNNKWFYLKKFTNEEIEIIYNTFKELNKL